ncbi:MAG: hypothetical protein HRT67_02375 [Flavobacteriaceae bacterium]|nr:hypothetical protein [Flavobacteriaceae bacterium]
MIAITDANNSVFSNLELEPIQSAVIPTEAEINSLIGASEFINESITTAFKNLLIRISNDINDIYTPISIEVQNNSSIMFNRVGFYYDGSNTLSFSNNDNALAAGTEIIIDELNDFTTFQEIAYNAFHDNSWAQDANNIRAMENSNLQKLHYITVYSDSNANTGFNHTANLTNEINILNVRSESTQRFLLIGFDNNTDANPEMPNVRIYNNSDGQLKFRVKVEYSNYVNPTAEGGMAGAFGPAIPNDNNLDGTIGTNENVHLNRHFLDYFPNQTNATDIEGDIYSRVVQPQSHWNIDFDDRIRGGEVTIEFFPEPENINLWNEGNHHFFKFHIRGKNPTYLQVQNYLTNQNYLGRFWFMVRKLRQESGSIGNFNGINRTNNNYEFRHFDRVTNINQYNHRKNSDNGFPVFGFPRGYGMTQIDNIGTANTTDVPNPPALGDTMEVQISTGTTAGTRTVDHYRVIVATDQEVWHWKENIDRSVWFLETEKMNTTINEITRIRDRVVAWNTAHPTDLVVIPTPEYYNTVIYCWTASAITEFAPYNNLFNQGTPPTIINQGTRQLKSFFDAMLLKTYNGIPNGHFMDINNASSNPLIKPVLTIYNSTTPNPFYVRNLSNRDD